MRPISRRLNCVLTLTNTCVVRATTIALARVKLLKVLWDAVGSEFAGRHELYERNYAGNYEAIRLENFPAAIATGEADRVRQFVDRFMAEYDLEGWTAPDLIDSTDVSHFK